MTYTICSYQEAGIIFYTIIGLNIISLILRHISKLRYNRQHPSDDYKPFIVKVIEFLFLCILPITFIMVLLEGFEEVNGVSIYIKRIFNISRLANCFLYVLYFLPTFLLIMLFFME